ncbi:Iron-regulated ABC transporter permease protein SufD [Halpernia humi]|uniref:Iron-regulated ABC transporter permease protein SufD n=1 Tax=Halpernia humi TaxID=493375 RepID=A0A1H5W3M6_9FLAO|nr:Fe-S cluster assembly protein SufD [Halpernia humi]SEF93983.1 Iron-regulated ABC transporter permease protein SufD [Halpernia humi]
MALFQQIEAQKELLSGEKLQNLNHFLQQGFPTKKDEEFKYTNLREIIEKDYRFSPDLDYNITDNQLSELHLGEADFDFIIFINGKLRPELSKISWEKPDFFSLKNATSDASQKDVLSHYFNSIASEKNEFVNLNSAFQTEGFYLKVSKNTVVEKPIHVFYISQNQKENTFYNVRNLLIAEEGAQIEIIESHHNFDEFYTFTNAVTEIFADRNSKADWHKLQNDSRFSYLIDSTFVKQERDSLATVNTFSFGGKLTRNNLDFIHNGENIHSFMNGITIIGQDQLVDHHTAVHHKTPNCESYQNYKGIFKNNAKGVFNGKVFVEQAAQKTNAYQQNNNILLDEGATIDTKPQLEIFADDVKCSHGCTVGQLNEEALFYLRARGIGLEKAKALLLFAFANDAMENVDIEPLKLKISQLLAKKLEVDIQF